MLSLLNKPICVTAQPRCGLKHISAPASLFQEMFPAELDLPAPSEFFPLQTPGCGCCSDHHLLPLGGPGCPAEDAQGEAQVTILQSCLSNAVRLQDARQRKPGGLRANCQRLGGCSGASNQSAVPREWRQSSKALPQRQTSFSISLPSILASVPPSVCCGSSREFQGSPAASAGMGSLMSN